jgi:hypothetical protein
MKPHELVEGLEAFLDELDRKPELDRTKREEQLIQLGRAYVDALRKYQRAEGNLTHVEESTVRVVKAGNEVAALARGYNDVNREYDLRDVDAETLAHFRKGLKK